MPEEDEYGALSLVCDDVTWAALRGNIIPAPTQGDPLNTTTRARPVYTRPAPSLSSDTPAVRAVSKEEKEAYVAYLKARSTLRAALLQSIGPTNKLSMEKALGDLLDVTPDEIYAKMVHDHGQLNMDDITKSPQNCQINSPPSHNSTHIPTPFDSTPTSLHVPMHAPSR